jgi:hypothetical protein
MSPPQYSARQGSLHPEIGTHPDAIPLQMLPMQVRAYSGQAQSSVPPQPSPILPQ